MQKHKPKSKEQNAISEYNKQYYENNKQQIKTSTKTWRQNNKERFNLWARSNRQKIKLQAIEYLGGACSSCGNKYHHACYDFHHRNPEEKDFNLARIFSHKWETIQIELDKCDLVCANCHAMLHYKGV